MERKITIAIDGFSSTGKSTVAKQLAQQLKYVYVDTGAMYRAVTLFAIQNGYIVTDFFDKEKLILDLSKIDLQFKYNSSLGFSEMYLNSQNVEKEIRTLEVSNYVSKVAEVSKVRSKLVEQQQKMGKGKGLVMDGRDIGTIVFPDAELKLFMVSSPETRAKRRFEELKSIGQHVTYDEVYKNIVQRDYIDTHRKDSPLIMAADAVEIDNSILSREEQLSKILILVKSLLL